MRFRLASVAVLLFSSAAAHADTVSFTINNATQTGAPGSTLFFNATAAAPGFNGATEYLNGIVETFTPTVPTGNVDDNDYFYSTYAQSLDPNTSFTGILFSLLIPTNAVAGSIYTGSIQLQGGSDPNSSANLGTAANVRVTVANTTAAPTPEPSSLLLLGTGTLGLAGVLRSRFPRKRRS